MVMTNKVYSPQQYLRILTDNCYIIKGDNDVETVEVILEELGYCLWSYPLCEIEHIIENELDVVLVDCMIYNKQKREFVHEYRWFEVDDWPEEEDNRDEILF